MDRKAGGNRRHRAGWMFAGAAVAVLCTSALRAEDRVVVKFAPPPTPFTNMVSHLAVESLDVDYMNMSMENMNLTSAVIGWSGTNRNFDRGGTYGALIGQFIYGSLDMGDMSEDADSIALYGPRAIPPLSHTDLAELQRLVRARYAARRRLLRRGAHVWDYAVGLSLIVSGRRPM